MSLHISRHTGRVTNRIHIPHRARFATPANILTPHIVVRPSQVVAVSPAPVRVVPRTWTCGTCLSYGAATLAAIGGIAAAIIGVILLSPAVVIIGTVVALSCFAFMPMNHRYQIV